ncbi:beta-ketoacyl synthase N-terminal-like domain-containing protein [Streptomyces olivoreticuli]|uniref:type I polyketide synthase n=1 Tax=Streptomyces olivoreticuli TaxID=68246 RepID=UPI00265A99EE|nr:beta-ketoacyl synthase N-terminal-like domain-containing protein [Streptomyces olivoreticuli]WKK23550.1 beta-ketoacyl synthase N-terminal-like domain-containing protein [Streptomyces olivoreticuli]
MATSTEQIVEALRAALTEADRLRKHNRQLLSTATEPIAIVGTACRFPGGADSPERLWERLAAGADLMTDVPEDRGWDLDTLFGADGGLPGAPRVRQGGFLPDASHFDADFFGISPREALAMDPQQRILLEVAWEACERAGLDPLALKGSRTGVFVGVSYAAYGSGVTHVPAEVQGYAMTGNVPSVASGRIAYALGLEGPAVSIDTACSSFLVALHHAAHALRSGDCPLALVGAANVMPTPALFVEFSRQRGMGSDGRVKAFAEAADGTAWAEGAGVLVVERLSDAQRAGHRVLAVVRGSALNQDGSSNGLTAPNGRAQRKVIRAALDSAGLTAQDVDAVEAHGTGTRLGDPIEAGALLAAYGQGRPEGRPLWLGSVKSNLGHAGTAAGAAGLIKVVEAMRHGTLPMTLHVDEPSRNVDWSAGDVRLLTEARPWPDTGGRPRRAAVSAFGISGTNAHVIVEEAPAAHTRDERTPAGIHPAQVLLPVAAKSAAALRAQARRLADHLAEHPGAPLADVGFSLATTRAALGQRAVVVAESRDEALRGLRALADGRPDPAVVTGTVGEPGGIAFLFTGQGAQRPGMGRELYGAFPVFADAFDRACASLDRHLGRPLREIVLAVEGSPEAALLDDTQFTQPATFALQVALHRLWESWGITPTHLIGHSVGELTAAHVAGVLSLDDACELVAARATLMQGLPGGGAMYSLQASEDEIAPLLAGREREMSVAAVNGPRSTVVSGDEEAVAALAAHWAGQGRRTRRLRTSHAFHSPRMDGILEKFRLTASTLSYAPPRIPVVSNVTGGTATGADLRSPDYWVRHIRSAVRFRDGMQTLADARVTTFVELGPDAVLTAMARDCLGVRAEGTALIPTLRRARPETRTALSAVAAAHVRGVRPDWDAVFTGTGARRVGLPTYAFQRQRFWLENGTDAGTGGAGPALPGARSIPATAPVPDAGRPALRESLRGLDGDERRERLVEAVRQYVAGTLGHASADAVAPERDFADLGFDSMSAVELSERLGAAIGLALPATLVLDHPTSRDLAAFLDGELARGSGAGPAPAAAPEGLGGLFLRACQDGRAAEVHHLMTELARFRPQFDSAAALGRPPRTVRLCDGPEEPVLICFPSFVWQQNFYQYARIASWLRGKRDVAMVGLPGFLRGEPLPASVRALTEVLADAARRAAGGRRFALLGHSGGGSVASATAAHLESRGAGPAALVLLDTPTWGGGHGLGPEWGEALQASLLDRGERIGQAGDGAGEAWITARARYATFDYTVPPLTTPTLLVRATEPLGAAAPGAGDGWRVTWEQTHTLAEVPGDHFSMLEADHAAATAGAVEKYLRDLG